MAKEWKDVRPDAESAWAEVWRQLFRTGEPYGHRCPSCRAGALRIFFLRHSPDGDEPPGHGGSWVWCPACREFEHSSCVVPRWWQDVVGVDDSELTPEPEWLDTHWDELSGLRQGLREIPGGVSLLKGFQIAYPPVFVPWRITQQELRGLLDPFGLREVTTGYFVLHCTSLEGLEHELGFLFEPRESNCLAELEFFRTSYVDPEQSFREFQERFESAFGSPTRTFPGSAGFPTHEWLIPGARIIHVVQERFGPEEHMRIQRIA